MKKPIKKYILWTHNGEGAYTPKEFDTVEEALLEEKYTGDWYLTETINRISAYSGYDAPEEKK